MSIKSKKVCAFGTTQNQLELQISDFERYDDDSSVRFKLLCRSSYFSIQNYDFFADFNSFKEFLPKLEKCYKSLSGLVKLIMSYEEPYISLTFKETGHVEVECYANFFDELESYSKVSFTVDQTFFPRFISELKDVYVNLKL